MPPETSPQRRQILVVDDDPNICLLLTYALEAEGFSVDTAANGMQALHKVRQTTPHAIILDLTMPLMRGDDFLYAWRAGVETPNVPVIAISEAFTGLRAKDMGVTAFFPKPFDLGTLVQHVKDLLAFAPKSAVAPNLDRRSTELRTVVDDLVDVMGTLLGRLELIADASSGSAASSAPEDLHGMATTALASAQRASALARRLSHLISTPD
jgi:DNA-binding response OmpR family regulator